MEHNDLRVKKSSGRKRLLFLPGGLFLFFLLALLLSGWDLQEGKGYSLSIFDRHGRLLRVFLTTDEKYRMNYTLGDYPVDLLEAFLLKEDQHFFSHPGLSPPALWEAALDYVQGIRGPGGSTITMQLARLVQGLETRNLRGKAYQIFQALALEVHHSKEEILGAYLNFVPFGGNIEGVGSASHLFFHKRPVELSLSESLMLAVIPQDPEGRRPRKGVFPPGAYRARMELFEKWIEHHPEDEVFRAQMELPLFANQSFPFHAPHFTQYIESRRTAEGGSVQSSLDLSIQKRLENLLEEYISQRGTRGVRNGALLLMDYTTGEVLAAIGSSDYFSREIQGQVSGFSSPRSPGSTLKPFVYALAMEQGLIHTHSLLRDSPLSFGTYHPDNFESDFSGPSMAYQALNQSRNSPAVSLTSQIRNPDLYDFLTQAGVENLRPREDYGLSIILGSAEHSMIELAYLYGALARGGEATPLVFSPEVRWGSPQKLLSSQSSYLVREILKQNRAPASAGRGPRGMGPVAFKTGTSIGFKDAWTLGFFDRYVLGVWIGNFDGEGNPDFVGRRMATPLFFRIAYSLMSQEAFQPYGGPPVPQGVREVEVCAVSGAIPTDLCSQRTLAGFIPGVSPIGRCEVHQLIHIDRATGYRTDQRSAEGISSLVWEIWPSDFMELFRRAGLPRVPPPSYGPFGRSSGSGSMVSQGYPPRITSPLDGGQYILQPHVPHRSSLVLRANADSRVKELFWFQDSRLLGKTAPGEVLELTLEPGFYEIVALDDQGRADQVKIQVEN